MLIWQKESDIAGKLHYLIQHLIILCGKTSLLVRPLGQRDATSPCSMNSNNIQSSPSSPQICKYDVFLSFRGTDTRNTFIDHLYAHMIRKGIFVFKDDKKLEEGKPISSQLVEAVRDSRVSIVVFSKDYATSTWCLDEIATIIDCQKELK